jgi:hypothetical protein
MQLILHGEGGYDSGLSTGSHSPTTPFSYWLSDLYLTISREAKQTEAPTVHRLTALSHNLFHRALRTLSSRKTQQLARQIIHIIQSPKINKVILQTQIHKQKKFSGNFI